MIKEDTPDINRHTTLKRTKGGSEKKVKKKVRDK